LTEPTYLLPPFQNHLIGTARWFQSVLDRVRVSVRLPVNATNTQSDSDKKPFAGAIQLTDKMMIGWIEYSVAIDGKPN